MPDRTWRDELLDEAQKWPASFRAELSAGHWRLQGANEDVYRALRFCAERFVREIRLPLSDVDPIDVLLDLVNEADGHVIRSTRFKKDRAASMSGSSRPTTASVSPLSDALIEYLNTKKDAGAGNKGDAAVATKNREIEVRHQIIEAFQRLGIPQSVRPDFVRMFGTDPDEPTGYYDSLEPLSFQPPVFDRLHESPQEWTKRADAAWRQHRDRFLKLWVTPGVDEEIPLAKSTRGTGRTGRRLNAPQALHVEWAARRLSGAAWKEIAKEPFTEDQVRKAAHEILRLADWPTKTRAPKTPKVPARL